MHMKATDLNRALNYVDDAYLMEADTPYKVIETESKEIKPMKTQKRAFRILLAAALIGVLSITAYAAEMLPIHKLESGKTKHYESYSDVDRAIAQVVHPLALAASRADTAWARAKNTARVFDYPAPL